MVSKSSVFLVPFCVSEIFSKYQRRSNLKSPLGLILLSCLFGYMQIRLGRKNMFFFAVDRHVAKTVSKSFSHRFPPTKTVFLVSRT